MISKHVSEEEIQLYVLDFTQVSPPVKQHLEQCADCMARVKVYELLFTDIQSLEKPSFDFDVAAMVLPQLEEKKKTSWYKMPVIVLAILLAFGLLSIPFFLFSGSKSGYNMSILWGNISPWVIGLISVIVVGFTGINIWDAYSRYRYQLDKLNFQ
jgi:hypothetical protein